MRRRFDRASCWRRSPGRQAQPPKDSDPMGRVARGSARRDLEFLVVRRSRTAGQSHGAGGRARHPGMRGTCRLSDYAAEAAAIPGNLRRSANACARRRNSQSVNYQIQYTPGPVEADGRSARMCSRPGQAITVSATSIPTRAESCASHVKTGLPPLRIRHIDFSCNPNSSAGSFHETLGVILFLVRPQRSVISAHFSRGEVLEWPNRADC